MLKDGFKLKKSLSTTMLPPVMFCMTNMTSRRMSVYVMFCSMLPRFLIDSSWSGRGLLTFEYIDSEKLDSVILVAWVW